MGGHRLGYSRAGGSSRSDAEPALRTVASGGADSYGVIPFQSGVCPPPGRACIPSVSLRNGRPRRTRHSNVRRDNARVGNQPVGGSRGNGQKGTESAPSSGPWGHGGDANGRPQSPELARSASFRCSPYLGAGAISPRTGQSQRCSVFTSVRDGNQIWRRTRVLWKSFPKLVTERSGNLRLARSRCGGRTSRGRCGVASRGERP